jgi:hypothetical protein
MQNRQRRSHILQKQEKNMTTKQNLTSLIAAVVKGSQEIVNLHDGWYPDYCESVGTINRALCKSLLAQADEISAAYDIDCSISSNSPDCLVSGGEVSRETVVIYDDGQNKFTMYRGWIGLDCDWSWRVHGILFGTVCSE